MAKKQFKAESKKLMDLMINSIYTNKEIFLRELISNASDAIDKLHYLSLTDKSINVKKKDFKIVVSIDEEERTITISDNGIGMTKEELENNLGTIAKSGSLDFKETNDKKKDIDIIGQFGVGFYSAFMVASNIKVISKAYGSDDAYSWESSGIDGYSIKEDKKSTNGTDIILTIKSDDDYNYDELLHDHFIESLIKKYSNYITYPIKMKTGETLEETINDMVPIWKRQKNKISDDDYNTFYKDKFNDYNNPLKVIHTSAEGKVTFNSLLFIPAKAPFDFYTKEFEKGLQLYSNGVLIMEKCEELLPDYYSFVKGVVDSPDLSLNISREMLQQDNVLKVIAKAIETKIANALVELLNDDREKYEEFFKEFGMNIKFGCYNNFGMDKDKLKDYLLFTSSKTKRLITLKEYIDRMKDEQNKIYYVCGETIDKIDNLPLVEEFKDKDFEILYCTNYMDEFVMSVLHDYNNFELTNISKDSSDLSTDEERENLKVLNEENKDMFKIMKDTLTDITEVRYTNRLKNHPVSLASEGDITLEMEKVINAMPTDQHIDAAKILEINVNHPIKNRLEELSKNKERKELENLSKILYAQARLIEGLPIDNPTEITNLICDYLSK